jgi:tetratricopeptide (TPR) repeat protein
MFEILLDKVKYIAATISLLMVWIYSATPSAMAETLVLTATYNYIFKHGETAEQAKVLALSKIRQALLKAAQKTIRDTAVYQRTPPVTNLAQVLAAGVMSQATQSISLQKTAQGYTVSLKVTGSIDKQTLERDLSDFIADRFLFDNALSNQTLTQKLLAELTAQNQSQKSRQANPQPQDASGTKDAQQHEWHQLIDRLAAIAASDELIMAGASSSNRDPARTLKQLNQAIAKDDRNPWLYLHRGRIFALLKDWVAAYKDFIWAAYLDPSLVYAHEFQGDALVGVGDMSAAIQAYTAAIDLYFQDRGPYLKRGRVFRGIGQYDQALIDFSQAITIDPNKHMGYIERAQTLLIAGRAAAAVDDFSAAAELIPDDGTVYEKRSRARLAAGQNDAACEDLELACQRNVCESLRTASAAGTCKSQDPSLAEKWSRICQEALTANHWERVIQTATLVIYHNPKAVDYYIDRSRAYAETGAFESALQDADRALKLSLDSAAAYHNRGLVYEKKGDYERAAQNFFKACEMGLKTGCQNYLDAAKVSKKTVSPINQLLRQTARGYHAKDWEAVVNLTTRVIKTAPTNTQAYTFRAAARAQMGELKAAIADCNTAIEIDASYGLAYNNRGYALEKMGDQAAALVDYRVGCLLDNDLACQNHDRLDAKNP